jgi:hypothetical protein
MVHLRPIDRNGRGTLRRLLPSDDGALSSPRPMVSSKSNATSSQPERTEGCRSAPLDAPPLPGVRIIAEAAIFWAGRLKQAGKIRNVELRAGIFCKIKNRGAKRSGRSAASAPGAEPSNSSSARRAVAGVNPRAPNAGGDCCSRDAIGRAPGGRGRVVGDLFIEEFVPPAGVH